MSIPLNDSIRVGGGKPAEDKRMNNGLPYSSVEQVNEKIIPTDRYISLEVLVVDKIYWYGTGIADEDLVAKTSPSNIIEYGKMEWIGKGETDGVPNTDMQNKEKNDWFTGQPNPDEIWIRAKWKGNDLNDLNDYVPILVIGIDPENRF